MEILEREGESLEREGRKVEAHEWVSQVKGLEKTLTANGRPGHGPWGLPWRVRGELCF